MPELFRYGLKLWSTELNDLPYATSLIENGTFDYIELMKVKIFGENISPFTEYNIPYIIHCDTGKENTDFGNVLKKAENLEIIGEYTSWADTLDAEHIILHPGGGDLYTTIDLLSRVDDRRILIENMPPRCNTGDLIGFNPNQIDKLKLHRFGFCFDFSHAIKAAIVLGVPYPQFITKFLSINPTMFHVSDGRLNTPIDEHLPIGDGDFDFTFLKSVIQKTKPPYKVTIETVHPDRNRLEHTIKDKKRFKRGY